MQGKFSLTSQFRRDNMKQCSILADEGVFILGAYNTKQREAVLRYIYSLGDVHVTASQIAKHFTRERIPVGRTTVYRHLDRLTEEGVLRRYAADGVSGVCYQYIGVSPYFHLKCECCGKLRPLECDTLSEIERHVFHKHSFKVNPQKTVLYGRCGECLGET